MIELRFAGGLLPAIAQDAQTREILMMAWINEEAFRETLTTGYATYFSRSRQKLWRKGEQSGCRQKIVDILVDCDEDCVIYLVEQAGGAACHTGHRTCFYRRCDAETQTLVETSDPVFDPEQVYHSKESASK